MAFNPSPKVAACRTVASQFKKDQVIILMVDQKAGTIEYASYGTTRKLCKDAKRLGDIAFEAIIKNSA